MDFGRLAKAGVTPDDMKRHQCFVNDFIWTRLSPGVDDQCMTVLDVGGIGLSTLKHNTVSSCLLAYSVCVSRSIFLF